MVKAFNGIMAWDGQNSHAVGHDDVGALAQNAKASPFKRGYGL
ncbi:MAG TPA: hypothetical protein VGG45_08390 [Terracidiphilus sp.]|jgi:hypothetical protein